MFFVCITCWTIKKKTKKKCVSRCQKKPIHILGSGESFYLFLSTIQMRNSAWSYLLNVKQVGVDVAQFEGTYFLNCERLKEE